VFTSPLPSNERRDAYIDTDWREGFIKYAVKMGSVAMILVPSFITIGSDMQKSTGGIQRHRQDGDHKSLL
jgi:hypothetical protein